MKLIIDYESTTPKAYIVGITANKSVNGEIEQTEITWATCYRSEYGHENNYEFNYLPVESCKALEEADEIVITLDEETDVPGYGISLDGKQLKASVIFETAEFEDIDIPMIPYYDVALIEKPGAEGLSRNDVIDVFDILDDVEGFPVEIGDINGNSSAMGFITPKAAEKLQYEYDQNSEFGQFISSILDDMNKESDDGTYKFKDLTIWMTRGAA